ncbi:MAG: hypothetical protein IPM64_16670 [Phycisphaerales bacterium]|nr:hypothetical protein [Phycisphaerales bacterium]
MAFLADRAGCRDPAAVHALLAHYRRLDASDAVRAAWYFFEGYRLAGRRWFLQQFEAAPVSEREEVAWLLGNELGNGSEYDAICDILRVTPEAIEH